MYFLGQAAHFSRARLWQHTFATGTKRDAVKLRKALGQRYQADLAHVALYHTGRSALSVALKMLLPPGSKVAINGFTCQAVVQAVKAAGCVPIYVDINRKQLHFSATELKASLTRYPDLKALIIQNTLGLPADIKPIQQLAKQYHLQIIEDLAHSVGTPYQDGSEAGTLGAATVLSFGKGKSIDTSCGGALILRAPHLPAIDQPTKLPRLADRLRDRFYPFLGLCMRLSRHLKLHKVVTGGFLALHWIARSADAPLSRKTRLTNWQARLALRQLQRIKPGRSPLRQHYFVRNRSEVLQALADAGYHFSEIWYDVPVSPARYYKKLHFPEAECPVATRVAAEIINFPNYYPESALRPAHKIIKTYQKELHD